MSGSKNQFANELLRDSSTEKSKSRSQRKSSKRLQTQFMASRPMTMNENKNILTDTIQSSIDNQQPENSLNDKKIDDVVIHERKTFKKHSPFLRQQKQQRLFSAQRFTALGKSSKNNRSNDDDYLNNGKRKSSNFSSNDFNSSNIEQKDLNSARKHPRHSNEKASQSRSLQYYAKTNHLKKSSTSPNQLENDFHLEDSANMSDIDDIELGYLFSPNQNENSKRESESRKLARNNSEIGMQASISSTEMEELKNGDNIFPKPLSPDDSLKSFHRDQPQLQKQVSLTSKRFSQPFRTRKTMQTADNERLSSLKSSFASSSSPPSPIQKTSLEKSIPRLHTFSLDESSQEEESDLQSNILDKQAPSVSTINDSLDRQNAKISNAQTPQTIVSPTQSNQCQDNQSISSTKPSVDQNKSNNNNETNRGNSSIHPNSNEVVIENGGITVHNETLPSNSSLISKIISTFQRKNRVFALQQNVVDKENLNQNTSGPTATTKKPYFWEKIIFDINENYYYYWLAIVSAAYVYNLLVVIARTVFIELAEEYLHFLWLGLDLFVDIVYVTDMVIRGRTGFLEQGLLIRDGKKIFSLYVKSFQFKLDLTSILPFDYFMLIVMRKNTPYLRFNRLLRRDRIQKFMEQTETRSSLPNAFRIGVVVWYIAIIIHWNACFYFMISESIGLGSDEWVYGKLNGQSLPVNVSDSLTRRYIYSFYWSTLILTTIGEVPGPQQNVEFAFVTIDLMCGVLIFATIVGNVGSMITNMSAARTEFQSRIDNIKQYMELRKVGKQLEVRVIKWFDYLWANKQNLADQQVLKVLPDKLQTEIAMHVHFQTLRKVRIFQDCEAGLLAELVLKLQLQVFSPMDYVCRKGDIGREMYIVKRGMLQVVAEDGIKVFATLSEGAVFGELSILNIAGSKNGNRRTANVRSVGYTDLFVLNKNDLWIALKEYPETKNILIEKGRELLKKDNLLDENAIQDNKTAEEIVDELNSSIRILQTRIARLLAVHTNTETKLCDRINYLEHKLCRYGATLRKTCSMSDNEDENEWSTNESQLLIGQEQIQD